MTIYITLTCIYITRACMNILLNIFFNIKSSILFLLFFKDLKPFNFIIYGYFYNYYKFKAQLTDIRGR